MRENIAFYPLTADNTSYSIMRELAKTQYNVVDYLDVREGLYNLKNIRTIYLNWLENYLTVEDKKILKRAKNLGVKIVWVFHNRVSHDEELKDVSMANICFLMKICDNVVLYSHKSKDYLLEYDKNFDMSKLHYIPHPDFVNDYHDYGNVKERLHIPDDCFVFSIFGSIRPYKNYEILIEAFERLDLKYNCRLLIAGKALNNEYSKKISELSKNKNIVFDFKYLNNLEMGTYLKDTDVMVLPYSLESSMNSGVMIMAFSYACPVIIPNIAMAEQFDDNLFYKYEYNSREEHVEVLHKQMEIAYLNGRERNREKGQQLKKIIKEKHDKEMTREALLKVL